MINALKHIELEELIMGRFELVEDDDFDNLRVHYRFIVREEAIEKSIEATDCLEAFYFEARNLKATIAKHLQLQLLPLVFLFPSILSFYSLHMIHLIFIQPFTSIRENHLSHESNFIFRWLLIELCGFTRLQVSNDISSL